MQSLIFSNLGGEPALKETYWVKDTKILNVSKDLSKVACLRRWIFLSHSLTFRKLTLHPITP